MALGESRKNLLIVVLAHKACLCVSSKLLPTSCRLTSLAILHISPLAGAVFLIGKKQMCSLVGRLIGKRIQKGRKKAFSSTDEGNWENKIFCFPHTHRDPKGEILVCEQSVETICRIRK